VIIPRRPDLKTLRVGLLSPAPYGPEAVRGEMTKRGALMAFDEANAARKPGELPFEVIAKADSPQWGSAANIAVEFSDTNALAFLGTIDGDATHVALRAVLKLEMLMVNVFGSRSHPDRDASSLADTRFPRQPAGRLSARPADRRGARPDQHRRASRQQPSGPFGRPALCGRRPPARPSRAAGN